MNQCLQPFPPHIRHYFDHISDHGGLIKAETCEQICIDLAIDLKSLMLQLLPLAAQYSVSPISSYQVGAIVLGNIKNSSGYANLYVGANIEFENQALTHSVHAEQAAVSNAWIHGETSIDAIAVTAAPCGHCRQFLVEVIGKAKLPVLIPADCQIKDFITSSDKLANNNKIKHLNLSSLLPDAFYPSDLGCTILMMQESNLSNHLSLDKPILENPSLENRTIESQTPDELINLALEAAQLSYAPYSNNYSGCAIQLSNGKQVVGRYGENVAYNPSLPAFSAAYSQALLNGFTNRDCSIKRVVVVEKPTKTSQKIITQLLLATICPKVELEYFTIRQN